MSLNPQYRQLTYSTTNLTTKFHQVTPSKKYLKLRVTWCDFVVKNKWSNNSNPVYSVYPVRKKRQDLQDSPDKRPIDKAVLGIINQFIIQIKPLYSLEFGKKERVLNYACQTYQLSRLDKIRRGI
jgi:hypothetical protein